MKRHLLGFGLLFGLQACGGGTVQSMQTLVSHIPDVVADSTPQGAVPSGQSVTLQVALMLRDPNTLDDLIAAQSDPNSAQFAAFLTPEQFAAQFHPAAADVAAVRAALQGAGLTVDAHSQGAILNVSGEASVIEAYFHTTLQNYVDPNGVAFFAPTTDVQVPENLPIAGVVGLYSGLPLTRHMRELAAAAGTPLVPATIRSVYNIPASVDGSGQSVALFELDGYKAANVQTYEQAYSLPNVPLTSVLVNNYSGAAGAGQVEVELDIELMAAMAPKLAEIRVYEGANSANGMLTVLNEIANPKLGDKHLVKWISCSWGSPESQSNKAGAAAENTVFKQMAAQGQTFAAASGDGGATDNGIRYKVDDPAAQPYVLGVGGTSLVTSGTAYGSESAWYDGGGGFSAFWPIPAWQQGIISSSSHGSTSMRNVPDVALMADPAKTGYRIYSQGGWTQVGGTSAAAPLWIAFLAGVDGNRIAAGKTSLGFVSPALYAIGKSAQGKSAFHDVTTGSNGVIRAGYPAVTGFDDATGWGTLNGAGIAQALIAR